MRLFRKKTDYFNLLQEFISSYNEGKPVNDILVLTLEDCLPKKDEPQTSILVIRRKSDTGEIITYHYLKNTNLSVECKYLLFELIRRGLFASIEK